MKFNNIKWFIGFSDSKESLRKRYHELVLQYHPDVTGHNSSEIREINNEYDTLYTYILNGSTIETDITSETVLLAAYHIGLFIRNKMVSDLESIKKQIETNTDFGKFIYVSREEKYSGWLFGREFINEPIYAENPPKNMKSGFYAYELSEKDIWNGTDTIKVARIIPDKTIEPASLEDIYNLIISGQDPWDNFSAKRDSHYGHHFASHDYIGLCNTIYTATSKNYGDIVYIDNASKTTRHIECITVFFKMNDVLYRTDVITKQLGPLDNIQKYSPDDIITLHKFGYDAEELFSNADFGLADVCRNIGFSYKDIVKDWPLDPILSRYVRLGVIQVYRHGYQTFGHFDGRGLYLAVVRNQIDLEDFDFCQKQFDQWYNDCLAKYKRDIKRGRVKIDI